MSQDLPLGSFKDVARLLKTIIEVSEQERKEANAKDKMKIVPIEKLALLNLDPIKLKKLLKENPSIAAGMLSFHLEALTSAQIYTQILLDGIISLLLEGGVIDIKKEQFVEKIANGISGIDNIIN